jgi:hypothetical protein
MANLNNLPVELTLIILECAEDNAVLLDVCLVWPTTAIYWKSAHLNL